MNSNYDVIIVGSGSAGCSASIYATRYNLNTLMISGLMPGGLISTASDVENYPGYMSINGPDLANKFVEHAKKLGANYVMDKVISIKKDKGIFIVSTSSEKSYNTKSIILTMGTNHRKLGVNGEEKLSGKGVSYCVTCDGPMYKEKNVAVIGGGNSAVEGAVDMEKYAKQVYLIYRNKLSAAPIYIENMRKLKKIVEISETNITEIHGETSVESIVLDKKYNGKNVLKIDGVFVEIGYIPNNELPKSMNLSLDKNGYVKVDQGMGTNVKGVFCAGDVNNASNHFHQQVTSAAEGAIAAQSAYRYIQGIEYLIK